MKNISPKGNRVSGVRINYLDNQHGIVLMVNLDVSVEVYEQVCSDGTIILKACEITVDDATIALRPCL